MGDSAFRGFHIYEPFYLVHAFQVCKEFAQKFRKRKGVLLLFGDEETLGDRDIFSKLEEDYRRKRKYKELDELLEKWKGNPLLYDNEFFHTLEILGGLDGALALNRYGCPIEAELYVEKTSSTGIELIPGFGTRHRAGGFASKNYDVEVVIVSEDLGTVTTYANGRIVNYLSFDSKGNFFKKELLNFNHVQTPGLHQMGRACDFYPE